MNAPEPSLPPLSSHPDPGSASRVSLGSKGWAAGFAALPSDPADPFIRPCDPTPLLEPQWLAVSASAAALIGESVEHLTASPQWLSVLSGCAAPEHAQPYAACYAGHQFGVFVPRLGDGRALNLGARNGWEMQLKGAGPTPYARFADGRAVLRSSIREFLCSEAMQHLGIPTTRALSLIVSAAPVLRETVETAAVVCRVAPSFVRFGNFEYFSSRRRPDLVKVLVQHVAPLLGPDCTAVDLKRIGSQSDASDYAQLAVDVLEEVSRRTARLMAQWMGVGFMHGVMNTDNFSILGLTIDYGPFGFMDAFDPQHICNHSDHSGRYSYQAQPAVGLWNIGRLANALYPLVNDPERLQPAVELYKETYAKTMQEILRKKLGLQGIDEPTWESLLDDFYSLMQTQRLDYTQTFRALCSDSDQAILDCVVDRLAVKPWLSRYREGASASMKLLGQSPKQRADAMRQVNPKYVLRNWIAEEVIRQVANLGDSSVFEEVFQVLQTPFDEHPTLERYAAPPPAWAQHLEVSCSS